jgi:substrate import-associated zinc metallohydrolase lipoprotein
MKKKLLILMITVASAVAFSSCNKDELDPESIITADKVDYTPFDLWLNKNYVDTYNILFKYRYEAIESDYNYYTVPADYDNSIILAHLVKYVCLEAYDTAGGIEFTRANFPKMIYCIGDYEYKNNGSIVLGTAEGGRKILLTGVNYLDKYVNNIERLNNYYFKTIHHEFTHILNQTKDMPTSYQFVTPSDYVADEWTSDQFKNAVTEDGKGYLQKGFVSAYSQNSYTEDFAEMLSMYLCYSPETWDGWYEQADSYGASGSQLIKAKLQLVKDYMSQSWGIDLDKLRATVQVRQANVEAGKIDLTNIDVD